LLRRDARPWAAHVFADLTIYLAEARQRVALATFDGRMAEAARRMSLPLALAP